MKEPDSPSLSLRNEKCYVPCPGPDLVRDHWEAGPCETEMISSMFNMWFKGCTVRVKGGAAVSNVSWQNRISRWTPLCHRSVCERWRGRQPLLTLALHIKVLERTWLCGSSFPRDLLYTTSIYPCVIKPFYFLLLRTALQIVNHRVDFTSSFNIG